LHTGLLASVAVFCVLGVGVSARAAELQKETAAAFDRYIRATEARLAAERDHSFLFIDGWPGDRRAEAYAMLRQGRTVIQHVDATEEGRPVEVPGGLIHHWAGVLFVPGATLAQTLALVQDYGHYHQIYDPQVRRAKLLERHENNFRIYLQMYKKSIVTVVMNGNFDVRFERLGPRRVESRSYSTRLAEVKDVDTSEERELPVDGGNGYLWRLYSYWRYEEKDGGVYVQLESVGLSRGVPFFIAWLVNPLLRSIPRGTLEDLLSKTRAAFTDPARMASRAYPNVASRNHRLP
jgi:hypothetical protein